MAINWDNVWKQNTGESRPAQRSATREGGAAVTGAIDWDAARARVQAEKKQEHMQEVKTASERRREAEAEQQRQKQARIDAGRQANKLKTLPQLMEGYAPEEAAALYQRQSWAGHPAGGSLVLSDEEKRALGMVNENGFTYGGVQPESLGMSRDEFAQLVGAEEQEPQPDAGRDEKKVGRWERNMHSTNYPAGMFAAGMMSQPASILAGAKTALGDAVTGGRVSDDMQKLEQYFAENPDVLRRWMAGENGAAWLIAQETGIDEAAMSAYKTAYFNDWMRGAVEDSFGAGVNDKFKNTVGNWAYTIGAQVPGLIYSGFAAPGGGESGGIVGSVIDAARNKAGVVDAASKATVDALKGNVATWLIGAGSTGGKITELARTRGYDPKQYLTALGNGFAEYFTEGLFGISDAASIQKIWDGADGTAQSIAKAIGQWLMSGAEEGLEEFVNVPMSRFADRITDKSIPLVGDGGLFDIREMVRNGVDGAIVGLLMGSVGAVTAIDSSIGSAKNARMAAEQLNRVIEFVPERVRPDPMDVSKATPESVQSKETEVLQALETVANEAMTQAKTESTQDAENDGRLRLPTLENEPAQPTAERGAEANTAPVEGQTKTAPETRAAAGLVPMSETEALRLSSGKNNIIAKAKEDIVAFVRHALGRKGGPERLYMGTMPEATAAMVLRETGVNVSGYTAILPGDSVQHIIKRHGDANTENARGQVAVSETDIALIPEVLSAPDSVTLSESTDVQGRSVLLFSKQIGNEYVTAQAVTDGRHALTTNSLWIKKGKDRPAIPNADKASPVENVQNALPQDPSAAPSIAQPQTEVNPSQDAENDGRLTLPTLEDEPTQPSAERAADANTAPVEPMAVTQARDILDEFEGTVQLTETQQRMVDAARETVQEWENGIGQPVGQTERTEQNDGTEQTAAAAEAGADPAVRGPERESAENDALADRAVAGGGQPRAAAQSQSKTAAGRSLKAEQLRLKPVSTKSLGLENGTDRARVTVYPREAWDAELTQAAKALEDKGYEVQFVLGALEFAKPAMLTDGCVVGDKVIVRANSMRHTATELCEHERFHTLMNENPGASAMIWEKVEAELRDSRYDRLVEQYVQAYLEAYEGDEARIQEELMADAYAGLNRFGEMPEVQRMVRELAQQFESGEAADLLQGQVEPGVRSSQTAREQNRTRDGTRFSIETIGGEPITVIDTQNDTREFSAAERYLKTLVDAEHPFSTILSDAQPVYLGKDLPGEYRESEYSKSMPRRLRAVKMQAATNLDEMLLLAENGEWRENVKPKHARDAKNGWYRYETQFAVPILNAKKAIDHYTVYGGTLLIRNDADGKSYLYDLLDIEKKKVISTASFSAKPHSEVYAPKPSSEDSIRSGGQNVKWENSGQEKYTAESGLEGKTAFMAAYEAARTEKANRQNEPQYSLTPETKADNQSLKEAQLQVIQQSNPADDTYHTWIRNVEDIHTLGEVLEDPEWDYDEFDPDYTRAMAEDAIQTGEIRVYSSYPISEGVFVTPSEMEAESYSADGRVYSEVVPIEDVAWIDPTQGQYAPVSVNGQTVDRTSYSLTQATEGRKMSSRARRDVNQTMNAVQTELRGLIEAETRVARDTQKQVLAELAQTVLDGKNISQEQINDAFETVWNAGRVVDRSAGEAAWDVKEYLRTQGAALSEADQANFTDWNAFRRSNFGRLRISKDGTPVDVAYGELNGMRPDLFPADIVNPADQMERMAEVAQSLQPKEIGMDSRYSMADKGQMMSQFVDMVQRMEQKLLTQRTPSARPQETQAAADETKEFWDALQDWMVEKAKRDGSDAQETIGGEDYAPEQPTDYVGMVDERNERLRTEGEQREAQMREELKARAMQMKKEGIEPGEILMQTQWYVDSNGEWRHWDDLPTKAAQPDSQGKQLQEAYLQHMTRDGFEGTASLDKLGVKVAGSVANYHIVDQLIENAEAAKAVRRDIRKAERRLNASQKEKAFASSLAAGVMDETDIPASMDRNTVLELADYYILERGVARNDLRTRRNEMYAGVDREVETLMRDREAYHISSAPVMMWRTPQRSMIRMFGREQGQKIYDYFFAPVAANEAERYRWVNRMYNEVREVEGSDGTKKPLNQKERALTQMLMEGKAVEEMAAQMEERQTVYNAAENLRKGAAMEDVAKEFGLNRELRDTVRTYAEWVNHREEIYNTDGVDVKRIENAAKLYAEKYDQFYAAINDFLVAHGYEPIGFIRGYAPHIQPETQQTLLQKALSGMGLSDGVTTLPASIAGRTSQFRPNKRWNPFFQSRNGDTTVYDVTQGYERYVDYLSDILYHTDDIVRIRRASDYFRRTYAPQEISETLSWAEFMRDASPARKAELLQDEGVLDKTAVLTSEGVNQQLEQYLSDLYGNLKEQGKYSNFVNWLEDYANGLAGKQSVLDRSFEMGVGRTAMNLVNKVTRAFQTANVAGNLSSVLNQSSQLPNIIAENGTRHTAQAIRDAATGRLNRDGWRERSDFLAGKKGIDKLIVSPGDKIVSAMFKPAEVADYMMSCVAVRSAYLKALSEGMNDADAMRYADRKAEQIMGSRMKGSAPQAFRSKNPVVKMLNMFQTEALNSFEHVEQDLIIQGIRDIKAIDDTQGRRAAAKALVGTLAKTILAAFLLNRATDELYGGTPAQYDLLGYAANFVASGNGITANQQIVDWLDSTWEACFGERLFDEPEKNDTFDWNGAMEGLAYDVNSDLPLVRNLMGLLGLGDQSLPMPDFSKIGDAVKATSEYGLSAGPAWLAAAGEFVPGGRQLNKTAKGAAVMAKGGSYSEDGKRLRYPVEDSAWNWGRALLFGPSALRETDAYYARGGGALSGKETTAYQDMVEAGVGRKTAYRTLREVRQLTPEDGSDSVRDIQKWELIAAAGMSESGKLAALSAMMNDSQREKLLTATDYGVTAEQYVAFRRLLSDAESQTQEAAQAAIDQMDGLTKTQKAVLWQLANKAWKAKNNPYSTKIGAEITGE